MKKIVSKTLVITLLLCFWSPVLCAQDEEDPGFPTNTDPGAPIDGHLFWLMLAMLGFAAYVIWKRESNAVSTVD